MKHWHWWYPVTRVEGKPIQHKHKGGNKKHEHRSDHLIYYGRTAAAIRRQA